MFNSVICFALLLTLGLRGASAQESDILHDSQDWVAFYKLIAFSQGHNFLVFSKIYAHIITVRS